MMFRDWSSGVSWRRDVGAGHSIRLTGRVATALAVLCVSLFLLLAANDSARAAMFTVINMNDEGPGSLRQALLNANATPGADTVQFNIPGAGPHPIVLETDLPPITDTVTIDGFTQPGSSPNTLLTGNNAVLRVELNGSSAMDGLVFQAGASTVRGLCLNRFSGFLIRLDSDGNVLEGNLLGTDLAGTMSFDASAAGVLVHTANNRIGGVFAESHNVISGTLSYGVHLEGFGANQNEVLGNLIGTDRTGAAGLPNSLDGVHITDGAQNTIGGIDQGLSPANIIAFNGGSAVRIVSGEGNRVLGNHIFNNVGLGIDLGPAGVTPNDPMDSDTGANGLQNFPVLNSAINGGESVMIDVSFTGTPNTFYRFEFFVSADCDPSGNGEGMDLGSPAFTTTDANGDANFLISLTFAVPPGKYVTATATDPMGNTSEYSPCAQVSGPGSFRFSAVRYSGNENGGSATITVVRTNGSTGAASVDYATLDGTAGAGADYTPASGTLQFAEGETSMTFIVPILDDVLSDGQERVILQLSNPTGGTVLTEPATAVLTLLDDEPAPVLKITLSDPNIILSWPTNAPGFLLLSADAMSGTNWSAPAYQVVVEGDQNTVTLPVAGLHRFYRLAKDADVTPLLTLGRDDGNVIISWPSAAVGFVLQSRGTLTGGQWQTLDDQGAPSSGVRSVTVTPGGATKFYRLIRQ